ncbi:MAG: CoA transferase, partial [Candidatus Aenigmatarchaeota archaeon]
MKESILNGIKVIDLTRYIPGPFCTMILSDLGADVIRVEQTGGEEIARFINPVYGNDDTLYSALNRGKRSIRL